MTAPHRLAPVVLRPPVVPYVQHLGRLVSFVSADVDNFTGPGWPDTPGLDDLADAHVADVLAVTFVDLTDLTGVPAVGERAA